MNVLLWILQAALAPFAFMGGQYKVFHFDELAGMPQTAALPQGLWESLGVFEMLCAMLLIVPAALKRVRGLTTLAAGALAVESVALAAFFARFSVAFAATNPLWYVVGMGLVAGVVAYGRYKLRPFV